MLRAIYTGPTDREKTSPGTLQPSRVDDRRQGYNIACFQLLWDTQIFALGSGRFHSEIGHFQLGFGRLGGLLTSADPGNQRVRRAGWW